VIISSSLFLRPTPGTKLLGTLPLQADGPVNKEAETGVMVLIASGIADDEAGERQLIKSHVNANGGTSHTVHEQSLPTAQGQCRGEHWHRVKQALL